jgi:hypothetical protein
MDKLSLQTMDNQQMNHTFFSETVRMMYNLFGYEALMKEVLYIHHLHQAHHPVPAPAPVPSPSPSPSPAPAPAPAPAPVTVSTPHTPPSLVHSKRHVIQAQPTVVMVNRVIDIQKDDEVKEEVKEKMEEEHVTRAKYSRSKKQDEDRCQHLTNKGTRCTLVRYGISIFCSRHTNATKKQTDMVVAEETEKKESEKDNDSTHSSDSK